MNSEFLHFMETKPDSPVFNRKIIAKSRDKLPTNRSSHRKGLTPVGMICENRISRTIVGRTVNAPTGRSFLAVVRAPDGRSRRIIDPCAANEPLQKRLLLRRKAFLNEHWVH